MKRYFTFKTNLWTYHVYFGQYSYWMHVRERENDLFRKTVLFKDIKEYLPWVLEGHALELTDEWLDKIYTLMRKHKKIDRDK